MRMLTALGLLAAGIAARAGDAPRRLEALDVFQLHFASDPRIAPAGERIVYVRQFNDVSTDQRVSNLWAIRADGSEDRPLTTGTHHDSSPRWSPDGSRIAYLSDRDGKTQIYVRWMDTGQTARVTNLESPPSDIAWSPDGKRISFAALVPSEGPKLAGMPAPPEGARWAEPARAYDRLLFRFNGQGYLKPGFTQLFVVAAEGGAPRQLTSGDFPHNAPLFGGGDIVWTPDGRHLLFSAVLRPDYEFNPFDSEVYDVSVEDGRVRQLTHRAGPDIWPVVSPDGKTIAYTGFDDRHQGHQTTRLYLMDRNGHNPRVLTGKLDRDVVAPHWAADGSGLYFAYDDRGDTKLGFAARDGSLRVLADHLGTGGSSYGGSGSFSVARDGAFVFPYTLPSDPSGLAVGGAGRPAARPITAFNRELLRQKKLGQVEEFWFRSPRDGRNIQGWVIRPPDFDGARKYPLILEIHGGPFANYGDRFATILQMWAARGYVVAYVNPRGSTSYGEQFANLIDHAYPGEDFYDLNAGVDALLAKGYIDPRNLFVTGGSGGGVLTCWVIGHTARFRAAASLYPAVNWYSWMLNTDLPSFASIYWLPGMPWDHPEAFLQHSPITYVGNVTTPTLLMTGEEDYRTPIWEAEQYYTALKLRKVEAELVRVPGEPHGITRSPSHEMAKMLYVAEWFDRHRIR
ncbi:MAG TPA: S9 family peptidase [Bryobacteraceae bacterium]|nr:S9 family peptidase [Bryobacteraceae bacterium]